MKSLRLILIIVIAAIMTGCHSQKPTTRRPATKEKPVALEGKAANKCTQQLMDEAYSWLGTPYKYGGTSKKGADCSGFVMTIFKNSLDIDIPRVSRDQGTFCRTIKKDELIPGDLVFFASKGTIDHVGLYVGENKMVHASSSQGVVICDLSMNYFAKHFHHAGMIPAYRDKVKALVRSEKEPVKQYSAMDKKETNKSDKKSKNNKNSKSKQAKKPSVAKNRASASTTPKAISRKSAVKNEIPASNHAKPIATPSLPPIQADSTREIQADTVHLMVYYPKK